MSYKISLVIDILIVLSTLIVIAIVVCKRRRTETFIVSLLLLVFFYGVLSTFNFIYLLDWDKIVAVPFFNTDFGANVLASLTNYILAMVYWVFAL